MTAMTVVVHAAKPEQLLVGVEIRSAIIELRQLQVKLWLACSALCRHDRVSQPLLYFNS